MTIPIESAYFLILKYPPLGNYIQEAFNRGDHDELLDYLFGLDTEPVLQVH